MEVENGRKLRVLSGVVQSDCGVCKCCSMYDGPATPTSTSTSTPEASGSPTTPTGHSIQIIHGVFVELANNFCVLVSVFLILHRRAVMPTSIVPFDDHPVEA